MIKFLNTPLHSQKKTPKKPNQNKKPQKQKPQDYS